MNKRDSSAMRGAALVMCGFGSVLWGTASAAINPTTDAILFACLGAHSIIITLGTLKKHFAGCLAGS